MDEQNKSRLAKQIESEIQDYTTKVIHLGDNIQYSQHKLVRRITMFESRQYPSGKFDKQGNYKAWYDIITPRIDSEVKNIDFDTKDIEVYSPHAIDETANIIINLKLREWLRDNGQAEELNSAIEEGAGWGNILWKKTKTGHERCDLKNTYIINQTARTVDQTPIIERYELTQSELREKAGAYKNIEKVIADCGEKSYKADGASTENDTTTMYYTVFERNGEVCLADIKQFRGEAYTPKDLSTYVFGKVIAAGKDTGTSVKIKHILFADDIPGKSNSDIYKEYHRGRYKGRWFREGLYELLFDIQVRSNEIGNQIARGLEWASKTFFRAKDKLIIQNVMTDLKNGDFIRSEDLQQVEVRMQGLDQLIAEYNRLINMANDIANSREVVQGITPASGTPLGTTQILNQNAGKLFDFIREKLSIPFREIFEEWRVPAFVNELKVADVIRLTGDSDMLRRLHEMIVENWYLRNLVAIGPHPEAVAATLKQQKMEELKSQKLFLTEFRAMFKDYKARVAVVITGENVSLEGQLNSYATFIALEQDPVRRSHLIEKAMRLKGIDTGALPRSTPEQLMGTVPEEQKGAERMAKPQGSVPTPV